MSTIIGVYLAAGKSARMGTDKLMLPIRNAPLGSFAFNAALRSELDHIIVVTTEEAIPKWMIPSFFKKSLRHKWSTIRSEHAVKGQAYSLQCGVRAAQAFNPEAIMVLLADQPFITTEWIQELISCYRESSVPYVAACYKGIPRPPVILSKSCFPDLYQLTGDEGARKLLRNERWSGIKRSSEQPLLFYDVDTEAQYRKLLDGHGSFPFKN